MSTRPNHSAPSPVPARPALTLPVLARGIERDGTRVELARLSGARRDPERWALLRKRLRLASLLVHEAETPAILYGPGDIKQAHSTNEWIAVDEIVRAARVITAAVARYLAT